MLQSEAIITKYGNAKIDKEGYYRISSRKEGNYRKFLHRLVWEDHYNTSIPQDYVIHHINRDKLDCRIQNLQCVKREAHKRFHSRNRTDESIDIRNTTGYYNVTKRKDKTCAKGFIWAYQYYTNGKQKSIVSTNLSKLEDKVKQRNLKWRITNVKKAKKSLEIGA